MCSGWSDLLAFRRVGPGHPSERSDPALVAAMATGDAEALAALYDRYAGLLLALGLRILGERREAEDLLHDVFLEAWRQADRYDAGRGSVRAWLALRMRSRALDRARAAGCRRQLREAHAPPAHDPAPDEALLGDRRAVHEAMAELPVEQRQALELAYFEGLSASEIAARVQAPAGTVKSRIAAALSKLRAALPSELGARGVG
jgi:RNA polymerase sigma-70 factor (ECF subfamily)